MSHIQAEASADEDTTQHPAIHPILPLASKKAAEGPLEEQRAAQTLFLYVLRARVEAMQCASVPQDEQRIFVGEEYSSEAIIAARSALLSVLSARVEAMQHFPPDENETQPVMTSPVDDQPREPLILPVYSKWPASTPQPSTSKLARRIMHKHRLRHVQGQQKQKRLTRIISISVLAAMMIFLLVPIGAGLAAYSAYTNIRNTALDGVNQLLDAKNLLSLSKSDPLSALDTQKLQQAQGDFNSAETDFLQLQQLVNRSDVQVAVQQFAPSYSGLLTSAKGLVQVGLDVSRMGTELSDLGILAAGILHGSPLASASTKPLITVADMSKVEGAMVHALYYIDDINTQMQSISLKDLPISDKQKSELTSVLKLLPQAHNLIVQVQGLTGIVSWLLGVGQKRRFLVQTLDRAEIRPSGGFAGQYAILELQDGRMSPFKLQDITQLDYNGDGRVVGRDAPPEYANWMKFGFWGLRDANLSADYPTTARLNMQVFQDEGGGPVDGDIEITPTFIAHILDVTGPIKVSEYGEIITSKNLEERLHYYQQNFDAIAVQQQKTGSTDVSTRKAFTTLVGKLLLERVRQLPVKQLLKVVSGAVRDIQSRDLQIYLANPTAEGWLATHGYTGAMDTFSQQDGFMVVQSNISISKASQYVQTTEHDDISLDAQGGATHTLTITLDYQQTGPVYGFDTYADYIRVYTPATAQFQGGDGFDTGQCLPIPNPTPTGTGTGGTGPGDTTKCCMSTPPSGMTGGTGGTGGPSGPPPKPGSPPPNMGCDIYNKSFPSNARYCANQNYSLGQRGYYNGAHTYWPVDKLGSPTSYTSDLPGRQMWGGLTETPKNCISTITLSWYVPNAVKKVGGHPFYELLVQKQGGYIPTVEITVDTSALNGIKPFSYQGDLTTDQMFTITKHP